MSQWLLIDKSNNYDCNYVVIFRFFFDCFCLKIFINILYLNLMCFNLLQFQYIIDELFLFWLILSLRSFLKYLFLSRFWLRKFFQFCFRDWFRFSIIAFCDDDFSTIFWNFFNFEFLKYELYFSFLRLFFLFLRTSVWFFNLFNIDLFFLKKSCQFLEFISNYYENDSMHNCVFEIWMQNF